MANLNVTYEDLRRVAQQLAQGQEELNNKLIELSGLVENLVASGFQADQSSVAYRETFDQFTTGTRNAVSGLEGLSAFLMNAADAMQQTDESLASGLKG